MNKEYKYGDIIQDNNSSIKIIAKSKDAFSNVALYKYVCLKCGCVNYTRKRTLDKKKNICLVCLNRKVVCGINDIATTDPWMIPYFKNKDDAKKYHSGSSCSVDIICPDCGRYIGLRQIGSIKRNHSVKCICGDGNSYPEKFFTNVLEQLNLEYIKEYSPDWIKPKRFDFYIPKLNIIVEMDGRLGHGYEDSFGKSSKELKQVDIYKDTVAKQYGICVYRIDSRYSNKGFLQQNILNTVGFISGISNINYEQADEFAQKNKVKMVADYYNSTKGCSLKDVCNKFHLYTCVANSYIQKCVKLGWISKELLERNKRSNCYKANIKNMKAVECIRDNKVIVFRSISEASRETGIQRTKICGCCKGRRKSAGGYIWKYA